MPERVREKRIKIPPVLLKAFDEELRILFPVEPAGLWPVPFKLLANPELMKEMISKEFMENFEFVIVSK